MSDVYIKNQRYTIKFPNLGDDVFYLVKFNGYEALSSLYRIECLLASKKKDIEFEQVINKPCTMTQYTNNNATEVYYNGIATEFSQQGQGTQYYYYHLVLEPKLARLGYHHHTEVYLNESIPHIIEKILRTSDITDYSIELSEQYEPRSFVCQYQESNLHFIMRWMEYFGIYFYFTQGKTTEKLIITDTKSQHQKNSLNNRIAYQPEAGLQVNLVDPITNALQLQQRQLPKKIQMQAYNYHQASKVLKAEHPVTQHGIGVKVLYGENIRTHEELTHLTKVRAQYITSTGKQYFFETSAVGLYPGSSVAIHQHYRDDFNQSYLITAMQFQGGQPLSVLEPGEESSSMYFYKANVTAIPLNVQFRPDCVTPRPSIDGVIPAKIDAEGSGKYAELDEFGRYKIRLPYSDKPPNKASAWIRKLESYVGDQYGTHFPLHKETEVLLAFENGNPDLPIIAGCVPNSMNLSQITSQNPSQSVIHTAGNNKVYMNDQSGGESLSLATPHGNTMFIMGAVSAAQEQLKTSSAAQVGSTGSTGVHEHESDEGSQEEGESGSEEQTAWFETEGTFGNHIKGDYEVQIGGCVNEAVIKEKNEFVGGLVTELKTGGSLEGIVGAEVKLKAAAAIEIVKGITVEMHSGPVYEIGKEFHIENTGKLKELTADVVKISAKTELVLEVGTTLITINATGIKLEGPSIMVAAETDINMTAPAMTTEIEGDYSVKVGGNASLDCMIYEIDAVQINANVADMNFINTFSISALEAKMTLESAIVSGTLTADIATITTELTGTGMNTLGA